MLQSILFITVLVVFFGYVASIWVKYGVLASISDSYYHLPDNLKFLFTLFCWGFAFPAIILGNTALMFVAGSGIAFVGAAAAFKEIMTKTVHYTGAFVGVACSQLSIYFDFHMMYMNIIFLILAGLIILLDKFKLVKNSVWWLEIVAFLSIVYVLGYQLM